jgi:hypothetical protein
MSSSKPNPPSGKPVFAVKPSLGLKKQMNDVPLVTPNKGREMTKGTTNLEDESNEYQ